MSGSPGNETEIFTNGTKVVIAFTRKNRDLPVAVGKTYVIVCGELGR